MRYNLAFFIGLVLVISPLAASAQTVSVAPENPNAALIAVLQQLVLTLTQELESILANQQTITNQQTSLISQQQRQSSTTEQILSQIGIRPTQPQTQPVTVDLSDLIITPLYIMKSDPVNSIPFGTWSYRAELLDNSGKHVKFAPIIMTAPDNLYGTSTTAVANSVNGVEGDHQDWNTGFSYVPLAEGHKTLTFTAGGFTKIIELDVSTLK